ncbi:Virulence-regulating protein VirS [Roseibium album]|uniref:Virulence-regulating protein VirS n=1 Tax=Roseibium album TaxID=311410 RepID=A0A0M6ZKH4_9HYPH|nr:Virulence-regulating protein VirS [Roseibium album]CTQ78312.1 Virulence-regulating protein VirS [Roseibium album]CTQ79759.1 Virulence-regulating protein VirS [Roseibium album]
MLSFGAKLLRGPILSEAEVDAVLIRAAVKIMEQRGEDHEEALHATGLSPADLEGFDRRVPLRKSDAFLEQAAKHLDDDLFGFNVGKTTPTGTFGVIAYLGISSATLEQAILNHVKYVNIFVDSYRLSLARTGNTAKLSYQEVDRSSYFKRQANEAGMAALLSNYRYGTGRILRPAEIHFHHQRAEAPAEMKLFFGCPIHFGSDIHGIVFHTKDLETPLVHSDRDLLELMSNVADRMLEKRRAVPKSFLANVEFHVIDGLSKGQSSASLVAGKLGMTERTFARRLADESTTFSEVLEDVRRNLSEEYLHKSDLSLPEIAFLLGYSDSPAFIRAYKRWFGVTPGARASEVRRLKTG